MLINSTYHVYIGDDLNRHLKQFAGATVTNTNRPKPPIPLVLDYYNHWKGAVIGQHPNVKMSTKRHQQVGKLLKDLLGMVAHHKRAKNVIVDIIRTMDNWLGCEYNEQEMPNEEFNPIYYGNRSEELNSRPTLRQQAQFRRSLRKAKDIIDRSYHDCRPLEKLHERFHMAEKQLNKWPKTLRINSPGRKSILPGTFVRLIGMNQIGIVFSNKYRDGSVTGYADGGVFHRERTEIRVLRKQPELTSFAPMRIVLPYGKWICEDGREVLFNRDYTPIWSRQADGTITSVRPDSYIEHQDTVFIMMMLPLRIQETSKPMSGACLYWRTGG